MSKRLLLSLFFMPMVLLAKPVEVTGVAATVNGKVITRKEVAILLGPRMSVIKTKYPRGGQAAEKEFEEAQEHVLDQLVENKIILSELEDRGANIPDFVVDQEVERIVKDLYNGNESEFRKALTESGSTMRSYKETQREKILVQALKSEQFGGRNAPPTPDEISAKYQERKRAFRDRSEDKVTFLKIFIPARTSEIGKTAETQLVLAEELASKLKSGADFATVAKEHSADAYSNDGGQWPETQRTDFDPSFAELIFGAPVGEVQGPFKDPRGFTIVKVQNINYGPSAPLSEVKERLVREIDAEKYDDRYQNWISVLKKKAIIDKRL